MEGCGVSGWCCHLASSRGRISVSRVVQPGPDGLRRQILDSESTAHKGAASNSLLGGSAEIISIEFPPYFLKTDSRNNFESSRKDAVS